MPTQRKFYFHLDHVADLAACAVEAHNRRTETYSEAEVLLVFGDGVFIVSGQPHHSPGHPGAPYGGWMAYAEGWAPGGPLHRSFADTQVFPGFSAAALARYVGCGGWLEVEVFPETAKATIHSEAAPA